MKEYQSDTIEGANSLESSQGWLSTYISPEKINLGRFARPRYFYEKLEMLPDSIAIGVGNFNHASSALEGQKEITQIEHKHENDSFKTITSLMDRAQRPEVQQNPVLTYMFVQALSKQTAFAHALQVASFAARDSSSQERATALLQEATVELTTSGAVAIVKEFIRSGLYHHSVAVIDSCRNSIAHYLGSKLKKDGSLTQTNTRIINGYEELGIMLRDITIDFNEPISFEVPPELNDVSPLPPIITTHSDYFIAEGKKGLYEAQTNIQRITHEQEGQPTQSIIDALKSEAKKPVYKGDAYAQWEFAMALKAQGSQKDGLPHITQSLVLKKDGSFEDLDNQIARNEYLNFVRTVNKHAIELKKLKRNDASTFFRKVTASCRTYLRTYPNDSEVLHELDAAEQWLKSK